MSVQKFLVQVDLPECMAKEHIRREIAAQIALRLTSPSAPDFTPGKIPLFDPECVTVTPEERLEIPDERFFEESYAVLPESLPGVESEFYSA